MKSTFTQLLLLIILFGVSFGATANFKQTYTQARDAYDAYLEGGTFDSAWQQFEQLNQEYPDHPAVQMYFGSLETIKARDAWMPWDKMKWVEQGLDRMDRALSLIELNENKASMDKSVSVVDVRLVAANTFLAVPSFLNRLQDAKDVFADLIETPNLDQQPVELRAAIYNIGVRIAEKENNSEELAKWQGKLELLNP